MGKMSLKFTDLTVGTVDGSKVSTFAGSNGTHTRPANISAAEEF